MIEVVLAVGTTSGARCGSQTSGHNFDRLGTGVDGIESRYPDLGGHFWHLTGA